MFGLFIEQFENKASEIENKAAKLILGVKENEGKLNHVNNLHLEQKKESHLDYQN